LLWAVINIISLLYKTGLFYIIYGLLIIYKFVIG